MTQKMTQEKEPHGQEGWLGQATLPNLEITCLESFYVSEFLSISFKQTSEIASTL